MSELISFIQNHIEFAPYLIFGLLLLAGFNIPVSEDGMLFIAALLASQNPDYWPQLYTAVYLGAYFSDLICYGLGRVLGPKLLHLRLFADIATPQRIDTIHSYYQRYGIVTLLLGRFIPFGVRNGLFLTAGLAQMRLVKFALSDLVACTISSISYFTLYYHYGEAVVESVKSANIAIFVVALVSLAYLYWRKKSDHKTGQK
ncbi:MAG: DedA family protein [Methylomonas sp.]|nr:DedA family protein [Methylomonas sp.]